ncbi:Ankyrin repeat protein [Penicillium malachiteum]|nr:Ankyrin repeat protein [Penicillium malachiteum]
MALIQKWRIIDTELLFLSHAVPQKNTKPPRAMVELLLKAGTDIEHKDWDGKTALALAVEKGHDEIVKLLITRRADLESRDKSLSTPLFHAAREGLFYNQNSH